MSTAPLLELENISYTHAHHGTDHGQKAAPLLDKVSLTLCQDSRIGLSGDNGCGKSTLLHLICGLHSGYSGLIKFKGKTLLQEKDFASMRLSCGYLLQHSEDQLFCPTILEDVAFGPLNQGLSKQEAGEKAWDTLKKLKLEQLADKNGNRLSGGEKKMAALASILSMQPELLLLDEPGNDLDAKSRSKFIEALNDLELPLLMVSHDWDLLAALCTEFKILRTGHLQNAAGATHSHAAGALPHRHT